MIANSKGNISGNKNILIIGGAGDVGSMAIEWTHALSNLTVIATASRDESRAWTHQMGADYIINHHEDLVSQLKRLATDEVGYVLSTNATEQYLSWLPLIMAPQSHLVLIDDPQSFDVRSFKAKFIAVHWKLMFSRSLLKKT
ncbi:zinc-binding dehydrogenase [Bartonella sp. HY038]|uniref:zinc-binding dehydrogenase n=1 Tax=Bartonella sp. HY038 TaxID=2759660 RepID=UPI0015FAF8A5|nr:zinc-binding dehydrogenase [Bartonella sp. HY038]